MNVIVVQQPTPRCPSCHGVEATVTTCRHCGYEYRQGDESWLDILKAVAFIVACLVVGCWLFFTLMIWFCDGDRMTLVELLASQWKWFTSLRVW